MEIKWKEFTIQITNTSFVRFGQFEFALPVLIVGEHYWTLIGRVSKSKWVAKLMQSSPEQTDSILLADPILIVVKMNITILGRKSMSQFQSRPIES